MIKRVIQNAGFVALIAVLCQLTLAQRANGVLSGADRARPVDASRSERSRGNAHADDKAVPRPPDQRRLREIETLEQQCLDEINRLRRAYGLRPYEFDEELLEVARGYSRRMAEERFFSHVDPDGKTVKQRIEQASIRWQMVGENLAYANGFVNPVAASLHGWMESPGHRSNILDPDFRLTAIGVWISSNGTVYFTEIFLKK
jgi:uncharacterized protein YkwD